MAIMSYLLLISIIQTVMPYDGDRLVEEFGSTLCPYMNYCCMNSSRNADGNGARLPSCLPCSCDHDCWELNSCCPDVEEIISKPPELPCKVSKVKEIPGSSYVPPYIGDIYDQRTGSNYRIISSCPLSENNKTLKRKCEGLNRKTLSDYIWVSDNKNGMIFQNIHCIKCHDVKDFWYWRFRTSCRGILNEAAEIEDVVLSTDCDIINVVPEDKKSIVSKYLCYDFDLEDIFQSDCNVSNIPEDLRKDFVAACHRSTWPYIKASIRVVELYKNVFCFVCQYGFDAVRDTFIIVWPSDLGPSFSALINYVDSQDRKKKHQSQICYKSQLYDPYVSKCRELKCPFWKYPHYGNCEKKFSDLQNACLCVELDVKILLEYDMQQLNASAVLDGIKPEIVHHVMEVVKRDNAGCHPDLIQGGTGPSFNISLKFLLGRRCDLYNVTDTIIDITDITTIDTLNNTMLDFSLNLDESCESKWRPVGVFFPGLSTDCNVIIRFDNDITCPQIELFLSDADAFSHEQEAKSSVFLKFFENLSAPSNSVHVCVDNYLKQMASVSDGCNDIVNINLLLLHFLVCHLVVFTC